MKQKAPDPTHLLYLAATKSETTQPLRRIMNNRARVIVERAIGGIDIPNEAAARAGYLEGVSGISEKVLGDRTQLLVHYIKRRYWGRLLNRQTELLKMELAHLRNILNICNLSDDSAAYARFLGRKGFDIESFLNSVELFARGREVCFIPLPDEKRLSREKLIKELRKIEKCPDRALRNIITLLRKNLSGIAEKPAEPYEIAAILTGQIDKARELLSVDEPSAYLELAKQKEQGDMEGAGVLFSISDIGANKRWEVLRSLSDIGFYADSEKASLTPFGHSFKSEGIEGFIAADPKAFLKKGLEGWAYDNELIVASKSSVQHELQHVFDNITFLDSEKGNEIDWEFRAYLGELVFSDERNELCDEWVELSEKKAGKAGLEAHDAAQVLIGAQMKERAHKNENEIVDSAMNLLNEAYQRILGLTYEQIIGPFVSIAKKNKRTG